MDKNVKNIIDGKENLGGFRGNPLRIGPSAFEIRATKKPDKNTLWHMRHRPFQIGGDANAEQRNQGTKRTGETVALEIPGSEKGCSPFGGRITGAD